MSDPVAERRWFRVLAFHEEWTDLLATFLKIETRQEALFSFGERLVELNQQPRSDVRLARSLYAEAENWLQLGRRTGYFPGLEHEGQHSSWPSANRFAHHLRASLDDLTSERLRFLALVLYSPEDEWSESIAECEAFVQAVAASSNGDVGDRGAVDRVSWFMNGAESQLSPIRDLPSAWRAFDASYGGIERLREVRAVRGQLLQVMGVTLPTKAVDFELPVPEAPDADTLDDPQATDVSDLGGARGFVEVDLYEASDEEDELGLS